MNWQAILGGILVWRYWKVAEHALLRLFPRYRRLERELAAMQDTEKTAMALYGAEKERTARLEAENLHQMKLVTDWTCMMNGWAPIYGVAPAPVEKHELVAAKTTDRPSRRQARAVAFELDAEFDEAYRSMMDRTATEQQ